jgi:hypothetical protein
MSATVSRSGHRKVARAIAAGWNRRTCSWGPCRFLRLVRRWKRERRRGGRHA